MFFPHLIRQRLTQTSIKKPREKAEGLCCSTSGSGRTEPSSPNPPLPIFTCPTCDRTGIQTTILQCYPSSFSSLQPNSIASSKPSTPSTTYYSSPTKNAFPTSTQIPPSQQSGQTPGPPTQSRFTRPNQQTTQLPQYTIPGRKSQFSLLLEATQPSSLPDYSSIPPSQPRSQVLLPTPPTLDAYLGPHYILPHDGDSEEEARLQLLWWVW